MHKSDSIGQLMAALSKAQAKFSAIPKNKVANIKSDKGSYSYKFADLADIIGVVTPHLAANGLSISQHPEQGDKGIIVTSLLGHESGEWLESTYTVPGATSTAQSVGSIITYARRYALAAILGVAPDEDVDGEQEAPKTTQTRSAPQQPAPTPAPAPRAGNLTSEQAGRLHKRLGAIGIKDHNAYATKVLGRPVGSLTEINGAEGTRLVDQAEIDRDALEAENAATAFAEIGN